MIQSEGLPKCFGVTTETIVTIHDGVSYWATKFFHEYRVSYESVSWAFFDSLAGEKLLKNC